MGQVHLRVCRAHSGAGNYLQQKVTEEMEELPPKQQAQITHDLSPLRSFRLLDGTSPPAYDLKHLLSISCMLNIVLGTKSTLVMKAAKVLYICEGGEQGDGETEK